MSELRSSAQSKPDAEEGFLAVDPADLLRALRRRWWIILVLVVVGAGVGAAKRLDQ